ncbi:hypothetical protein J3R83DRAFT_5716 [Lanmaoa asiatica]|nr:hypothetical protein J3R83DRAFT_5716 [Lanmaoa asiatica]
MHNIVVPPPTMDSFAPEFCFCGEKTVRSHEFWFCSTQCARLDSLRSLDDPECHYRVVVRKAYDRAGVPELYPRRIMSVDHLRPGPSEQHSYANAPSRFPPPTNLSHQRNVAFAPRDGRDRKMAGFPALSQVTGKVITKQAAAGEPPFAERHDRLRREGFPNAPSRAHPSQTPRDHTFEQISLDAIPLPEYVPARSLRHVPQSSDGLRNNIRKSVAALLNVGRSRRSEEDENPERVFGHPVNIIIPPTRKDSLPSHRQMSPSFRDSDTKVKSPSSICVVRGLEYDHTERSF